jgi:hypothetical protein
MQRGQWRGWRGGTSSWIQTGYHAKPATIRSRSHGLPRKEFLYWSDDGDLFALRYNDWKIVFIEQNHEGLDVWMQGFNKLRIPKIFNPLLAMISPACAITQTTMRPCGRNKLAECQSADYMHNVKRTTVSAGGRTARCLRLYW